MTPTSKQFDSNWFISQNEVFFHLFLPWKKC